MLSTNDISAQLLELFKASNPSIHKGNEVFKLKGSSDKEIEEFLDSLPSKAYNQLTEFFENIPSLYHEVKYTNSKGTERVIPLSKLNDFFTLV